MFGNVTDVKWLLGIDGAGQPANLRSSEFPAEPGSGQQDFRGPSHGALMLCIKPQTSLTVPQKSIVWYEINYG